MKSYQFSDIFNFSLILCQTRTGIPVCKKLDTSCRQTKNPSFEFCNFGSDHHELLELPTGDLSLHTLHSGDLRSNQVSQWVIRNELDGITRPQHSNWKNDSANKKSKFKGHSQSRNLPTRWSFFQVFNAEKSTPL